MADADAEDVLAGLVVPQLDIGHGHGVGALGDGVGLVVHEGQLVHLLAVDGVEEGVDGAVALAVDGEHGVLVLDSAEEGDLAVAVHRLLVEGVLDQLVGAVHLQVLPLEQLHDVVGLQLLADPVALLLYHRAELAVHGLGHIKAELVVHDEGRAALAGLGVDAHRLVLPAQIGGVDGQVGHHPLVGAGLLHIVEALVDGVLVAAGEGGEHQIARVGLALGHPHLGAALVHLADAVHMAEVQLRVDALHIHIHCHGDEIHIAGALAVAEQAGLHALRAGQQTGLGGGHAAAPVIVGVQGDDGPLTAGQLADKILQLVGELVGHAVLHRGGQVQNDLVLLVGMEVIQHRLADLHGGVHLGAHEGLGRVLKAQIHALGNDGLGHLIDEVGGVDGDLLHARHVGAEHDLPLKGGGGVIEVENDVLGAPDGLKGLFNEVFPGLHQHLNGHVIRDVAALDELAADLIVGVGGGGKADLDLLDADLVHQHMEHLQLFLHVHGVNEGLVAVSQIHGAPLGGMGDEVVRPGAVLNGLGLEGNILFVAFHGFDLLFCVPWIR